MNAGISNPWQILNTLDTYDVCHKAQVDFDTVIRCFTIKSLSQEFSIFPQISQITGNSLLANDMLLRIHTYMQVAIPFYLVHAQENALSGHLVNPRALKGGAFFTQGTHALPLTKIAVKYGTAIESFLEQGNALGGENKEYGDAAWEVFPLPRVPVSVVMWREDDEFPPRAELLFDATPTTYLPIDILWAIAMMCVTVIL